MHGTAGTILHKPNGTNEARGGRLAARRDHAGNNRRIVSTHAQLAGTIVRSNREIYGSVEFDAWARRAHLEPAEEFVIKTFLDPRRNSVEAGTGGGRIILAMADLGFTALHGFDFVPVLVCEARSRDARRQLKLSAQDATRLAYGDACFDQIIYLEQVVCLIEGRENRLRALGEAFRILRPGGTALFSFLSYDVRSRQLPY